MPNLKKAKKAALKRERLKREKINTESANEGEHVKLLDFCDSDLEPEDDENFEEFLDCISVGSESDSEYSCGNDDGCELECSNVYSDSGAEKEDDVCLEECDTSTSIKSENVWKTFTASTFSELQDLSVGNFDGGQLFENMVSMESSLCCDKTAEDYEELVLMQPVQSSVHNVPTIDADEGMLQISFIICLTCITNYMTKDF